MVFKKKIKSFIKSTLDISEYFFNIFIPDFCILCETKLFKKNNLICPECLSSLERVDERDLLNYEEENLLKDLNYEHFYSLYRFEANSGFQKLIHSIKYKKFSKLGVVLGEELGKKLKVLPWFDEIDIIIPVPIHFLRRVERGGYNQSAKICKGICNITGKNYQENIFIRKYYTSTQTLLNAEERSKNLRNAFQLKDCEKLSGKHILIVDDICTTGSTIKEVVRELNKNNITKISIATLAVVRN